MGVNPAVFKTAALPVRTSPPNHVTDYLTYVPVPGKFIERLPVIWIIANSRIARKGIFFGDAQRRTLPNGAAGATSAAPRYVCRALVISSRRGIFAWPRHRIRRG